MAAVPQGWQKVEQFSRTNASLSAAESRPGGISGLSIRSA
jgi:hypothetical protein